MARPIVVTRPGAVGRRLADRLLSVAAEVAWWPAFDIGPAADPAAARHALRDLHGYDLAVFVSVNAVEATRELLSTPWPASTAIAVVGAATRAAALTLPGAAAASMIAPDDSDEEGSEGLWRAWVARGKPARRVALLRAEHGREWLAEQFRGQGAEVESLAVYRRVPHSLVGHELARLQQWVDAGRDPAVVVSSTEAIAALDGAVSSAAARAWLRSGVAVATHDRIAGALRRAGYARVICAAPDDAAMVATLESLAA